jgi:anthranilate synthase/aminodeoxychorismate synthase-like glutamine amidotransferase
MKEKIPTLGVCLGHQAIAHFFGGSVIRAAAPIHGKVSKIKHQSTRLFHNAPENFFATRYHSLVVSPENLPICLKVTAIAEESSEIMALEHCSLPLFGMQFHPESIQTTDGLLLLHNFLSSTT